AGVFRRQAVEPGEGALLCPTGRCADGSCCGPNNICGYGPDFCGPGCLGDCDATAMCGVHSAGGNISCGLDLCCSWGGWCGSSEVHCVGPNQWALCQEGFGKCEVIRPATYGENSGSTNGRSIGYYQAWNSRDRACNRVLPDEIQWQNYTHLFFAFASVNPQTFAVVPANPADHQLMLDFTALKRHGVQTWIAVGGFDFSDPGTPTHTTWSDICATPANRAAFISSLAAYMTTYGFQGVDLDWEYPGAPERGGNGHADVTNFVSLLREMRLAYGASFGISLTLAPDYWYLRWFDVAGLEPYVDHMGLMAYDLHGFWDSDVEALGAIVRPQADVSEIYNSSIPLAYAGVNFAKITFGVAWYGRGYTLADPSCNTVGCPFAGPSKPSRCINSAGVMSLDEIKDLIAEKGLTPRLIPGAMMKEISWDDQWIGYDDEETIAMKRGFANNLGFGGIMAWSVDFNSGKSESAPVSTDGTCGSANGARICEGSGFGDCCSGSGWCGSTGAHCGSGCQSGNCTQGAVTTDGRCGAQANNAICAGWPAGDCCSPAGYCGLTEAHCGTGCQNGPCENGPVQPSGTPVQSSGNPGQPTGTPVQSS
ncbi:glycoside hydrolase superfamily, partial [Cladorrhinum sp. PSN332]